MAYLIADVEAQKEKIVLEFDKKRKPSKLAYPARLQTLDQNIYNPDRLWRVPNTKNTRSGLYKIPLSVGELRGATASEIIQLAKQPRPLSFCPEFQEVNPKARQLFIRAWQNCQRDCRKHSRHTVPEEEITKLGYEVVYLNRNGKPVRGKLPQNLSGAAAQLARKSNCPVVLAVKR